MYPVTNGSKLAQIDHGNLAVALDSRPSQRDIVVRQINGLAKVKDCYIDGQYVKFSVSDKTAGDANSLASIANDIRLYMLAASQRIGKQPPSVVPIEILN